MRTWLMLENKKKQSNNSYKKLIIERGKDTATNNKSHFSTRCRQWRVLIN